MEYVYKESGGGASEKENKLGFGNVEFDNHIEISTRDMVGINEAKELNGIIF